MLGDSRLGRVRGFGLLALGAILMVFAACQLVAGIQTRTLDPIHGGCALPTGSGPQVRLADLVPSTQIIDLCIRPAGASWGEPLILNGGTDCGNATFFNADAGATTGFAYTNVTVPFTAPAAKVDVKIIEAGGTCSSTTIAEADGLALASGQTVTTLAFIGGNGVKPEVVALPESDSTNPAAILARFVHAMPGVGPLDFGVTTGAALPTFVGTPLVVQNPISFGKTPTKGEMGQSSPILDNGYDTLAGAVSFSIGAGVHGTNPEKAVLLWPLGHETGPIYSVYAVGIARNSQFPQRGLVCQENATSAAMGNPLLIQCTATALPSISVDVFNTGLYGPGSPFYAPRSSTWQSPANPYIKRDTDIVCLTELDFPADTSAVLSLTGAADAGGSGQFPYSYWKQSDMSTPATNGKDINGNPVPTMLPTPPCSDTKAQTEVSQVLDCFEQKCSTKPGSPNGIINGSTDCLTNQCLLGVGGQAGLLKLLSDYPGCLNCIIDYVASNDTFQTAQTSCETSTAPPFGFNGQTSVVILSRYPLIATDTYILPSTNYRQAVSYARVQLEDSTVDFYCGFFSSTLVAGTIPYPSWGFYGNGGAPGEPGPTGAYAQEQLLQAQDLIGWVQQKSGSHPAIIAGDWRSGEGTSDGGLPPADSGMFAAPIPLIPATVDKLSKAFTPVVAPGWAPGQCNFCPASENILNSGQPQPYFVAQPFLANWGSGASTATIDESLLFTEATVALPNGMMAPISPYYGLNFHVQRPQ
jgi:hypothetical protein